MAIKKSVTGHGKSKCGKYKCKGGCGKGEITYPKSGSKSVSDYIALQKIANSDSHYRTFITKNDDGKQDIIVEVIEPNGKTKLETFKGVSTIPSDLKHRIFVNEETGNLESGGRGLLKGVTEIIRQQNKAATQNSNNIDEQFEKQALRHDPHLTIEQKWVCYEDALVYIQKGDERGAIDCCARMYPGFSGYMANKREAVHKLAQIKHRDEPSRAIVMKVDAFLKQIMGANESEGTRTQKQSV